jgi:hypothetical protein
MVNLWLLKVIGVAIVSERIGIARDKPTKG